jgi:hypothetical protein
LQTWPGMKDSIRGKTIAWRFTDGPTAGKGFEHDFADDGTVTYRMEGSEKSTKEKNYEVTPISKDVVAVSYLASSGWTLTSVLDFATGKVVSFASNEKQLVVQHGSFSVVDKRAA